jgi:hypothetical protein
LINAWEEICVQVQGEESFFGVAYEETIYAVAEKFVLELKEHEKFYLWLETNEGSDWLFDQEDGDVNLPVVDGGMIQEVTEYIIREYIYEKAGYWTNQRIRDYLGE